MSPFFFVVKTVISSKESIVPISDLSEITELKSTFTPNKEKALSSTNNLSQNSEVNGIGNVTGDIKNENKQLRIQVEELKNSLVEREKNIEMLKNEKKRLLPVQSLVDELKKKGDYLEEKYFKNQEKQNEILRNVGEVEKERDELLVLQKSSFDKSEFETLGGRLSDSITTIEQLKEEKLCFAKSGQRF